MIAHRASLQPIPVSFQFGGVCLFFPFPPPPLKRRQLKEHQMFLPPVSLSPILVVEYISVILTACLGFSSSCLSLRLLLAITPPFLGLPATFELDGAGFQVAFAILRAALFARVPLIWEGPYPLGMVFPRRRFVPLSPLQSFDAVLRFLPCLFMLCGFRFQLGGPFFFDVTSPCGQHVSYVLQPTASLALLCSDLNGKDFFFCTLLIAWFLLPGPFVRPKLTPQFPQLISTPCGLSPWTSPFVGPRPHCRTHFAIHRCITPLLLLRNFFS